MTEPMRERLLIDVKSLNQMRTLADIVLDYYWFLNFCEDEELVPDRALELIEEVAYQIENELSEAEKAQLQKAAADRLAWWLRGPDENGYTPRKLLKPEQKEFLESIAAGHFSGSPGDQQS